MSDVIGAVGATEKHRATINEQQQNTALQDATENITYRDPSYVTIPEQMDTLGPIEQTGAGADGEEWHPPMTLPEGSTDTTMPDPGAESYEKGAWENYNPYGAGGGYLSSSGILAPYHKKLIDGLYAGGRISY
jgi:hypothetical protein